MNMKNKTFIKAPSISISELSIQYKQHSVFNNFKLHLPAKRWTCLLGPSGIGKTSLLRFIAGLAHEQDRGNIRTSDGQSISGRVSYMTQQDSLLPWLNILDNILIGFALRNEKITNQLKERAQNLLQAVHLTDIGKSKPHQLSHGMRQRVALVRSIIEDRQIILMDEPFSALDVLTKLKLQKLAAKLFANCTILLVTHDPLEALRLADHIHVLKGRPAKIYKTIKPRRNSDVALLTQQASLLKILTGDEVNLR
jgi:putative hydroxymethylpyrimidine transport system ATP-binding protein